MAPTAFGFVDFCPPEPFELGEGGGGRGGGEREPVLSVGTYICRTYVARGCGLDPRVVCVLLHLGAGGFSWAYCRGLW
jgi:hypothetical protein